MEHRNYTGQIAYMTNGAEEFGRERFSVTVQADGSRTLAAECALDTLGLYRHIVQTIDPDWRPVDAYIRDIKRGVFAGAAWYRFAGHSAQCTGLTAAFGPIAETRVTDQPIRSFASHSLQSDAWLLGRFRRCGGNLDTLSNASFTPAMAADGGNGPALMQVPIVPFDIHDLGTEAITVGAGRFQAHHIRVEVTATEFFDIWALGDDCVPVRIRANRLGQSYELAEINGDFR